MDERLRKLRENYIQIAYGNSKVGKYTLAGTCVDSFDEHGESNLSCFSDVSDFAVKEENSVEIPEKRFKSITNNWESLPNGSYTYLYNKESDVVMAYNEDSDVHYFFIR